MGLYSPSPPTGVLLSYLVAGGPKGPELSLDQKCFKLCLFWCLVTKEGFPSKSKKEVASALLGLNVDTCAEPGLHGRSATVPGAGTEESPPSTPAGGSPALGEGSEVA